MAVALTPTALARLDRAVTYAENHRHQHNQAIWLQAMVNDDSVPFDPPADEQWCGMAGCVGGWMCLLEGDRPMTVHWIDGEVAANDTKEFLDIEPEGETNRVKTVTGRVMSVRERVAELLELNPYENFDHRSAIDYIVAGNRRLSELREVSWNGAVPASRVTRMSDE